MEQKKHNTRDYVQKYYFVKSNRQIARELGVEESNVRQIAHRLKLPKKSMMDQSKVSLCQTPEEYKNLFVNTLRENGFKGDWDYGWVKTDGASIKISNDSFDTDKFRNELIDTIKNHAPKKIDKLPQVKDGHLLIIDPADVHVGKLASTQECSTDYGVAKAVDRVLMGIEQIIQRTKSFTFDEVLFVIGNDVLHTDTPFAKTTAGTPQNTDQMWYDAFRAAFQMYISSIDRLLQIAKVNVVFNPSNHDFMSGYFLAQSLEAYYTHNKNVVFDTSIKHRKYYKYGNNLIGTSHGDGANESNLPTLMAQEAKSMWGETKHWYWYLHHVHHMKKIKYRDGEDYNGVTIEYLRAVSPSDGWHTRNGYVSNSSMTAFVHHKEQGQVARITFNYN